MKSIFTKLSTLLLCGAVALVGCTDYSEDIQAVDKNVNDLKTEFEGYKTSTAATIAELQSAINALEAAQEKMAAEYAKKSELESAVTTLQNLVAEKAEALQAALTDAAGKIAALEAGKADKTEVAALQEQVTKAIEDAKAEIKALEAAKADKAELELVKADVASLIEGYTQTIVVLQNLSTALTATQEDLDVVEADVEALKTAAAEAVYAITNLQASIDAISARVESLEKDLAATKQQIAQHTEALTNLAGRLEAVEGAVEDEAALRAEADEALQQAVMLLNDGLTNLSFSYNAYVEEMEAYKENLAEEMDELRAQDAALANSILSYYNESIAAVDSAIATLREEQAAAIADLKAEILAAWEDERALIYNTIYNIQTTLETAIEEGDAALQEQLDQAVADIYKTILSYVADLQVEIAEGDANIQANLDDAVALIYKTIENYAEQLRIEMSEIAAVLQKNIDDLTATVTKNYNELNAKIDAVEAALVKSVNAVINRVEVLEGNVATLEEQAASMKAAIEDINATIEVLQEMDAALAEQIAQVDADAKKALKDARKELQAQLDALFAAKEELEARVAVLEQLVADNAANIENNRKEIEANIKAISNLAKQLGTLEATVNALMQSNAAVASALQAKDLELQNNIDAVVSDLAAAIARIGAVEDAVKALQELAATLASKDELAKLEQKMNQIQDMLLTLIVAAEDRANDKIQQLRNLVAEANEAIAALRGDVDDLLARVQSLVYVPEFNDHKATIEWAKVAGSLAASAVEGVPAYTVAPKASVLKYFVKAQNAAEVANAIAADWENVLSYEVKAVMTRAAAEAALEIVNVVAEGEFINVSVVAKNFAPEFFENNASYSAALVLTDGNNTRSTEYTNLLAGKAAEYVMKMILPVADSELADEVRIVAENEVINYLMPCTDTKTAKTAVKPIAGFIPVVDGNAIATNPVTYFTAEQLVAEGYDIAVERMAIIVCEDGTHKRIFDAKADQNKLEGIKTNYYFNIAEGPKWDYIYTVKEGVSFDYVGEKSTVQYVYTFGNAVNTLTYEFELDNAQLIVNIGKYDEATGEYYTEVPWTVALRDKLATEKVLNLPNIPYVGYDDLKTLLDKGNAALTDWSKVVYVKSADGKWVANDELTSKFSITEWQTPENPLTVDLAVLEGGYVWNNEYKVVYTSTNPTEHIDVTTNIVIKFTHKPTTPFVVNIPVEFNMSQIGNFQASVDVLAEMYNKVAGVEEGSYDYLGFGDKNAETWATYVASVPKTYMDGCMGNPVVNGNKLAGGYVSNIYNLTTAQIAQNQYVAGQDNVITWDANGILDMDFDVTISGKVNIPQYALLYSRDLASERIHVNGRIEGEGENAKYVITQADLAKYFNVSRIQAAGINENHKLTVEFAVTDETIASKVKVANSEGTTNFVTEVQDNKATYLSLKSNEVVLDWNEYLGLEVPVTATLKVNGFVLGSLDAVLWTDDPLTLTNTKQVIAERVPGKNHTTAKIYEHLSLTSVLAPETNLIDNTVDVAVGENWSKTYTAAKPYGANMTIQFAMAEQGVYYEIDGEKIYIDHNKFKLNAQEGTITLFGDDADLNVTYIAKCQVFLTHKFCDDKHKQAQTVTVKFVPKN